MSRSKHPGNKGAPFHTVYTARQSELHRVEIDQVIAAGGSDKKVRLHLERMGNHADQMKDIRVERERKGTLREVD